MRILLADDHNMVRDALKSYIERLEPDAEIVSVDSFTTAYKAVDEAGDFALVILDLRMPGMDGLDGLRRMRERLPDVPVVIMSGGASHEDVRTAIDLGAQGFLPKTLTGPALVSAIRLIMAGEKFVPFGAVDAPAYEAAEADGHALLTQREREVLQYLEKGWSNKEIARALELQEVTIKLHIRGICRKLGAKNRTQAALRAQEARRLQ
ncbi:response regulator transcription factor [Skermanella mucosa]|uniref:response regulator n=1 Tax=Skermanella mucosa TaxID=1789672 RepID=UPI00192CA031|nr:response regulator transcription factor [Skermanella mucosa]UEM22359.1 response regulator transcription factor [Skermanella mucosa]